MHDLAVDEHDVGSERRPARHAQVHHEAAQRPRPLNKSAFGGVEGANRDRGRRARVHRKGGALSHGDTAGGELELRRNEQVDVQSGRVVQAERRLEVDRVCELRELL